MDKDLFIQGNILYSYYNLPGFLTALMGQMHTVNSLHSKKDVLIIETKEQEQNVWPLNSVLSFKVSWLISTLSTMFLLFLHFTLSAAFMTIFNLFVKTKSHSQKDKSLKKGLSQLTINIHFHQPHLYFPIFLSTLSPESTTQLHTIYYGQLTYQLLDSISGTILHSQRPLDEEYTVKKYNHAQSRVNAWTMIHGQPGPFVP